MITPNYDEDKAVNDKPFNKHAIYAMISIVSLIYTLSQLKKCNYTPADEQWQNANIYYKDTSSEKNTGDSSVLKFFSETEGNSSRSNN